MSLSVRILPMSEVDEQEAKKLAQPRAGFSGILVPALAFTGGVAGMALSFRVIGTNTGLAAGMMIGGVIAIVVGGLTAWGRSVLYRAGIRSRRGALAAVQKREVEVVRFEADAAWRAPSSDEDVGAVLFQVETDVFVYVTAWWLDEHAPQEASAVYRDWEVRRCPGMPSSVLGVSASGAALKLGDLPEDQEARDRINSIDREEELFVWSGGRLPASWRKHIAKGG